MSTDFSEKDKARKGATGASKVGFSPVANLMPASMEAAPYLGRAHAVTTKTQKDVVARMVEDGCQMGSAEITRVLEATGFYVMDRMPEELCGFDIGFVKFSPALGGSFPSMDAEFDATRNRLYVAAAPSAEIREALAGGVPSREMDASMPRIIKVTWGDGTESNTVKSGEPLKIYGTGLTLGKGDESALLLLPDGRSVEVALDPQVPESDGQQRLVGRMARTVDACKGAQLILNTHGPDLASGLKRIPSGLLTVIAGTPAPIAFDFAQTEGVNEGQVNETADTLLHVSEGCEIPAWGEGDSITLTGRGQTWTMPTPVVDTESMTYGFQIPQDVGGTLEEDDPCEFNIRSGGRTGTLAAVWKH